LHTRSGAHVRHTILTLSSAHRVLFIGGLKLESENKKIFKKSKLNSQKKC